MRSKPSTLVELAGFIAISVAAALIEPISGLFVAGFSLILIGWAIEDEQAIVRLRRLTARVTFNRLQRKAARAQRRAVRRLRRKAA